ncbi:MAG: class I SAM-dependent rRNA methyltransferase [Pseudomonadota bacterium]
MIEVVAQVWLKKKAERPVALRHPWIFSGAVERIEGSAGPGDVVRVVDASGRFLAWGAYNPASRIQVRLLDWDPEAVIDQGWWDARIEQAITRRQNLTSRPGLSAYRLVFGEADFLPGLVVDWYNGFAVMQALTPLVNKLKHSLARTLHRLLGAQGVYERSPVENRVLEGMDPGQGVLSGSAPPDLITIEEGGHRFLVNVLSGQKTGFFLDQRENRPVTAEYARGREVLDCFAYTNAFSVYSAKAGAKSIIRVESSAEAVELGQANLELNDLAALPGQTITGDVFRVLREFRDQHRSFDLIILDPPRLAPTRAQAAKASRAYKDINLLALKLLRPGGILATFSCSGGIPADLFQKIIFGAGLDAGREVLILKQLGQGPDHPVRLSFPESMYLKGLLCQVL